MSNLDRIVIGLTYTFTFSSGAYRLRKAREDCEQASRHFDEFYAIQLAGSRVAAAGQHNSADQPIAGRTAAEDTLSEPYVWGEKQCVHSSNSSGGL